ncbi:MAG TPA: phosphodiesterase [Candidatus Fournierella merdigallinarum]|nr:phosphodiesterase [Candidatus Fournierella merdigallinarum]
MKLLIASDLHGSAYWCEKLLERIGAEQPDKILLLGDLLYHGPRNDLPRDYAPKRVISLLNGLKDKIIAVRGNCDAEVDQMVLEFPIMADYTTLMLENGRTLFATHGHLFDPDHLPPLPAGSAFAFGHIHTKHAERQGDLLILNPGSLSIPKDGSHSYMIYENGVFTAKTMEGEPVASVAF